MKYGILFILLWSSFNAYSTLYCSGKVDDIYIDASGDVVIKGAWRNNWTKICNLKNADVVTCSMWTSLLTNAVKDNLKVNVSYTDGAGSCSGLATYGATPTPRYVMMYNPAIHP